MNIVFSSKALDRLPAKTSPYIVYHASGERGTGRLGVRVYTTGKKKFIYRHFVGKTAKFQTLGEYPDMPLSKALEQFEALSESKDVIKTASKGAGTLEALFEAHKEDFFAAGKRSYKHYISLRSVIAESGLLPESTIANKITTNDCRAILNYVYKTTGKRQWVNEVRSYMCALFSWGMKSDKSPVMDVVQSKFDIPFNPVTAIPTLACDAYVGERYLSFDELAQLLNDANSGEHFTPDISVFLKLVFFCCGQRPYEILAAKKEHYNRDAQLLSIPPGIAKTKKMVSHRFKPQRDRIN